MQSPRYYLISPDLIPTMDFTNWHIGMCCHEAIKTTNNWLQFILPWCMGVSSLTSCPITLSKYSNPPSLSYKRHPHAPPPDHPSQFESRTQAYYVLPCKDRKIHVVWNTARHCVGPFGATWFERWLDPLLPACIMSKYVPEHQIISPKKNIFGIGG